MYVDIRYHHICRSAGSSAYKVNIPKKTKTPPLPSALFPFKFLPFLFKFLLSRGIHIGLRTLGPVYRIVCRDGSETGPILGVTSGFLISPLGLMHCDALQIFTQNQKGDHGSRTRCGLFGLGVLIGGATFAFGWERNCKKAEILAINDDGEFVS